MTDLPPVIDRSGGFQRELGIIPELLLHGPAEALAVAWVGEEAGAMDRIVRPLLVHHPQHFPKIMEELG